MLELETQRKQLADDMEEIKMRYGGDLEDVTERLEVSCGVVWLCVYDCEDQV